MKEGFWINYETREVFEIDEHERWIRRNGNADKLGVDKAVFKRAMSKYKPTEDRDDFLKYLMARAPIMRVRGHIHLVTFEFHAKSAEKPREMIKQFGEKWFGPFTQVNMYNFANDHAACVEWSEFMEEDESFWSL